MKQQKILLHDAVKVVTPSVLRPEGGWPSGRVAGFVRLPESKKDKAGRIFVKVVMDNGETLLTHPSALQPTVTTELIGAASRGDDYERSSAS